MQLCTFHGWHAPDHHESLIHSTTQRLGQEIVVDIEFGVQLFLNSYHTRTLGRPNECGGHENYARVGRYTVRVQSYSFHLKSNRAHLLCSTKKCENINDFAGDISYVDLIEGFIRDARCCAMTFYI